MPLSLLNGMLNLMTELQALITFKYSAGMFVLEAALSKKSLTCSRKRGSLNSSSFGPKFAGSTSGFPCCAYDEKLMRPRTI